MKLAMLALLLSGFGGDHCNGASIYPVYDRNDVATDDRVLGTWWSGHDQGWIVVAADGGPGYGARWFEAHDSTDYNLVLARIGDMRLADVQPPDLSHRYELLRLHWYSRLELTESRLAYQPLDDDWVATYVRAHPGEIDFLIVDGAVILTAAPRDVQRFLRRHWDEPNAWGERVTLSRVRPGE